MPQPAESMADRDARLVKAEMQRDRAVALLRRWNDSVRAGMVVWDLPDDTREFLEALDA